MKIYNDAPKRREQNLKDAEKRVIPIIEDVRKNGDKAIKRYTKQFDGIELDDFVVSEEEIAEAYKKVTKAQLAALKKAMKNIAAYAKLEMPKEWMSERGGVQLGKLVRPLERVGCYVPGGNYSLCSTVLMTAVPAKVAGVAEVIVCTPPRKDGAVAPATLVACDIAGANKIFKIGGAQAIAAMAYGTESVPKVDKIVGPGNIYVTAAKKTVYGDVGIDFLAGPSEVMIIADERASPKWVAADLLAQAEHDANACALLVTPSKKLIEDVKTELKRQLEVLPTREIAEKALENYGAFIVCSDMDDAIRIANEFAPEHLEIMSEDYSLVAKVKNAGAVFLGKYGIEVAGDYAAGPNHVLPTGGVAKMRGGLSARDFVKEISIQRPGKSGLSGLKETVMTLAELEGLSGHANSMRVRFE